MKQTCRATRIIFLTFGISTASWAPLVPLVKRQVGLDNAQLGLLLSLAGLGIIFALLLSSWLIKRFGSGLIAIISGVCMLASLPLLTIASTFFSLGIALFLFNMAGNALNIAMNTQALTIESQSGKPLMSGFHCLCSVGNFLGVMLMECVMSFDCHLFYSVCFTSASIAFILTAQRKKLLPDKAPQNATKEPKSVIEGRVFGLGLLCFVAFMSEGCMLSWSGEFLCSSLQYSPLHSAIGFALFSMAMASGRLLGDRIIAHFGQFMTFQVSCFIVAVGFMILCTLLWPYAELLGFVLIGLGGSNMVPILFSLSGKFPKTAPSYVLSIVTFCGYVGSLIGPLWIGYVANAFSLAAAFAILAAALFVIGFFNFQLAFKTNPLLK